MIIKFVEVFEATRVHAKDDQRNFSLREIFINPEHVVYLWTTLDDDETATLSIQATDTATEAGGVQTTDVTLSLAGSGTGTLSLAAPATAEVIDAGGGSAISGADYTALVTQTVTFATGSTNGPPNHGSWPWPRRAARNCRGYG